MGAVSQERKALDPTAYAVMVLLTALWGFQQVTIKVVADEVSLVMQAAIRSIAATALLLVWARLRGARLFERDGTLPAGIAAGLLFAAEFVFIYAGLEHTHASRMVVFVYLTPPLTALGLHFFVRGERLVPGQWLGVLLAFAGLVIAFGDGLRTEGRSTLLGDLFGLLAAVMWAATTIVIRATRLARTTATKTLFYQLAVSAALLPLVSILIGEKGVSVVTPLVVASLAYQGVIVAFASYLAWFWLLTRYLAARLSVLSFLTPMFGVLFGVVFLSERLTGSFAVAALLIATGIALVNLRR
ncbi:MAG TPA: DMT family transporter [Burkholderiales bacterium]|nr:DMT family transporter [Burkholderiales bacterium]